MKSDDAALTACKAFLDDAAENGVYRLFAPLCLDTFARAKHGRELGDDALRSLDAACVVFFRDRAPWPVADRAPLHRRWCALLFEVYARAVGDDAEAAVAAYLRQTAEA